jgi:hypothetical protein
MSTIDEDRGTTRTTPLCNCCTGSGEHEYRPFINASPYDTTADCTACGGSGLSWHDIRGHNTCAGYKELVKRNR